MVKVIKRILLIPYNALHGCLWFLEDLHTWFIQGIPSRLGPWNIGYGLRYRYWKKKVKKIGKEVLFQEGVFLYNYKGLSIGSKVSITARCILDSMGEIEIGDDVFIGPGSTIYSVDHDYEVENIKQNARYKPRKVTIGNNVWIGARVCIRPGVSISDGSVVGMGSVVAHDVPADSLVVGNPARAVKHIERH